MKMLTLVIISTFTLSEAAMAATQPVHTKPVYKQPRANRVRIDFRFVSDAACLSFHCDSSCVGQSVGQSVDRLMSKSRGPSRDRSIHSCHGNQESTSGVVPLQSCPIRSSSLEWIG